jgi:hypothetical protein
MCSRCHKTSLLENEAVHIPRPQPQKSWRIICLLIALTPWNGLDGWAASVSTYAFGRYEILVQEGTPVAIGEVLGLVRRQTGLPEYPLMLHWQKGMLQLSILGPGNHPIGLVSTPFKGSSRARAATVRFIVESTIRQDETLTLQLHRVSAPKNVSLAVNLARLERMLEGER